MHRLPLLLVVAAACGSTPPPSTGTPGTPGPTYYEPGATPPPAAAPAFDRIARMDFNRIAVQQNLPVYWIADRDQDKTIDADEIAELLFYPPTDLSFAQMYERIVQAAASPGDLSSEDGKRRELVRKDLDQGRATLVFNDLSTLSAEERTFVGHMMKVADLVDDLYELQNGSKALADKLPPDPESHSLFRRNRGPKCIAPATEKEPLCSAIPGNPKPVFDLYPPELATQDKFCAVLEKHKDAKALLSPFTVVRGTGTNLTAVPYTQAYATQMTAISNELTAAADAIKDPAEQPLVTYLRAAAAGIRADAWGPGPTRSRGSSRPRRAGTSRAAARPDP